MIKTGIGIPKSQSSAYLILPAFHRCAVDPLHESEPASVQRLPRPRQLPSGVCCALSRSFATGVVLSVARIILRILPLAPLRV